MGLAFSSILSEQERKKAGKKLLTTYLILADKFVCLYPKIEALTVCSLSVLTYSG